VPSRRPAPTGLVLVLALTTLAAQACAITGTVTGARSWTSGSTDSNGTSFQTEVNDSSGHVQDIVLDPSDARPGPVVAVAPGGPGALDVTWNGGGCDDQATIDIAAAGAGLVVAIRTHRPDQPCDAIAIRHVIRLTLDRPIPPGAVAVRQ
jgi:hypothetical protein